MSLASTTKRTPAVNPVPHHYTDRDISAISWIIIWYSHTFWELKRSPTIRIFCSHFTFLLWIEMSGFRLIEAKHDTSEEKDNLMPTVVTLSKARNVLVRSNISLYVHVVLCKQRFWDWPICRQRNLTKFQKDSDFQKWIRNETAQRA
jgi:hypothetical protein